MTEILAAALSYAERGWGVIPLHAPINGGCSCGRDECTSVAKHPRTQNGLKDATTEEGVIREWWRRWPKANVGVVTGEGSGLVVLDQDSPEAEEQLKDKHMPPTPHANTGKGVHRYFAHPGGEVRNFARRLPGLDLRGDGGRRASGRTEVNGQLNDSRSPCPCPPVDEASSRRQRPRTLGHSNPARTSSR